MVTITWQSMNIDQYIENVFACLKRFEQLIININDVIENRIEKNLKDVTKVCLVQLPNLDKPLTLDAFVVM